MKLDLTKDDARFLHAQVTRRLEELQTELVHSENRAFRTALTADVTKLENLAGRLAHLVRDEAVEEFV